MSSLFILPFTHAFLPTGLFAGGSKLTFYQTGTTALATIVDEDGDALPNPISSDAFGIFPTIYLEGDTVYRVVLSDIHGNVLNQLDPLPSILGGPLRLGQTGVLESIFPNSESLSLFCAQSTTGNYAGTFFSQSSDNHNAGSMSTTGVGAFTVNNNTTQQMTTYSIYGEARAVLGAGRAHVAELNQVSLRTGSPIQPGDTNADFALTEVLRLSSGRGDVPGSLDCSTFITMVNNGAKAQKGIVVGENSISSGVALALPQGYNLSWYYTGPGSPVAAQISDSAAFFNVFDAVSNYDLQMARGRPAGADVQVGDGMGSITFRARKGGLDVKRAFIYASANTANGAAIDIMALNQAGDEIKISLHGTSNNCFASNQNGVINLGDGSHPWAGLYANQISIGGVLKTLTVDGSGFVKAA